MRIILYYGVYHAYPWGVLTFVTVGGCTDEQYDLLSITSSYVGGAGSDNVLPVLWN